MLRKSFSIKRSENSKVRTFNPVESGTCFAPVSLCRRQHLNYFRGVRGHWWLLTVTGGTNRTTESSSKNTAVCGCCKPSITVCPHSERQHSCQSLHTPKQPCRNANKQTATVFCPLVPSLKGLRWRCVCSGAHLGPGKPRQACSVSGLWFSRNCLFLQSSH